jgi:hypothetical protein
MARATGTKTVIRHVHGGAVLGIHEDPGPDSDAELHEREKAKHLKALERQGTEYELVQVDAAELAAKMKDAGGDLQRVRVRNGHVEVDR